MERTATEVGRSAVSSRGTTDVAIVGGGVIGLSIAYVLAGEGIACAVFDSGPLGREASWAGAGIISPGAERPTRHPAAQLRTLSAGLHEEWSRTLRVETGIDNGYRRTGGVDVALDDGDEADLRSSAGRWRLEGIAFEKLEPGDFERVEPALGPEVLAAYFLPDRAQIRNPRHVRALIEACERRGVTLRPGEAVRGFDVSGDRVVGLRTSKGIYECGQAVIAAGAWSESLLKEVGVRVETPPIRGQIVLLKPDQPIVRRIVEHGTRYLVPRDDGRILIGSTEELAGFDRSTSPEGIEGLVAFASQICPALGGVTIERSWAGLRPGSADRRPSLGSVPGWANLFVATGHQRAGLQLSPGSAVLMADLLTGRTPRIDLRPFAPDRAPSADGEDAFRS